MYKMKFLCGESYCINDFISLRIPLLQEIKEFGDEEYLNAVYQFCSTPSDFKLVLHDAGMNYGEIDDYEFFLMIYRQFSERDKQGLRLVFGDFDITKFELSEEPNPITGEYYLALDDKIFDKAVYLRVVDILRQTHNFARRADKPGNEHTYEYTIEKERRRLKYQRKEKKEDRFFPLIVALVNTAEFKYDYTSVWSLNIYQFYQSVKQIQKNKDFNYVMQGIYGGTVDSKKINMDKIHWLNGSV